MVSRKDSVKLQLFESGDGEREPVTRSSTDKLPDNSGTIEFASSCNKPAISDVANLAQTIDSTEKHFSADDTSNKKWLATLAGLMREHYHAGKIDKLQESLQQFKKRAEKLPPDPELGNIETAACHGLLKMAEFCCDQLRFQECFDICGLVKKTLEVKKARYIRNGMTPKPDSTTWVELLTRLAECKWKSPEPCSDAVISLEAMVGYYQALEVNIRQRLHDKYTNDLQKAEGFLGALAWSGTFLLGAVSKYQPAQSSKLEDFVNYLHEGILEDASKPYFWHLAIIQEFNSEEPCRSTVNSLFFSLRRLVVSFYPVEFDFEAFKIASEIEQSYLNKQIMQPKI